MNDDGAHTYCDIVCEDKGYETIKGEHESKEEGIYLEIKTNRTLQPRHFEEFKLNHCAAYIPAGAGN